MSAHTPGRAPGLCPTFISLIRSAFAGIPAAAPGSNAMMLTLRKVARLPGGPACAAITSELALLP
jgi:hypothetical protein